MDYSKLRFDISTVGANQCVIDVFPELKEYVEFANPKEDDILRWVILTVDDGSELFRTYKSDWEEKARYAYKFLKLQNAPLRQYIEGMPVKDEDRKIIESKIFKYFIIIDKDTYNTWYSKWKFVQEMNAFLRIQIDPKDDKYEARFATKQKISKSLADEQKELAAYERQVFGDSKLKQIATKEVAKITNWPEKMAKEYKLKG